MHPVDYKHVIPYYSPISSSGGKRRNRKQKTRKNKKSKRSRTRRNRHN
jgi:hypothetical protein